MKTTFTMKTCIFISRHEPTQDQIAVAAEAGYRLVHVGDVDAFDTEAVLKLIRAYICSECPDCGRNSCDCGRMVSESEYAQAVACVHPMVEWIAAADGLDVLVFKNDGRAPLGERPSFKCCGVIVVANNGGSIQFPVFYPIN